MLCMLRRLSVISTGKNVLEQCLPLSVLQCRNIHHIGMAMPELEEEGRTPEKKSRWLSHNEKIFPPQLPGEEKRPAYVCHWKPNIKYSPKKMWYIACFVRGMSVDEAIKQLSFVEKKGASFVKQTILEAQELAVEQHNVEFKTNLWVAESFCGKGEVVKGFRRHARGRAGSVEYKYCHYYVRLEEGKPPKNYYNKLSFDKDSMLQRWIESMRQRNVINSL